MTRGGDRPGRPPRPGEAARRGRLTPTRPVRAEKVGPSGQTRVASAGGGRPALRYVPPPRDDLGYRLVVLLHGAGGSPEQALELLQPYADDAHLLLLAPASNGRSWDVVVGGLGPDVAAIDELVQRTLAEYPVEGIAVCGFSDGASYALTLGVANGDSVDAVVAFSPGFAAAQVAHGSPRVFVSHGTRDGVLPIDVCSRRLVPRLRAAGLAVTYEEFDGAHEVPRTVRRRAVDWLAGSSDAT